MALVPINWVSQRCVIDRSLHVSYAILAMQLPLERILRHLATHHVFQEVSPGVFSHNLLSSLLDTGKDFEVIKKECVGSTLSASCESDSRPHRGQPRREIRQHKWPDRVCIFAVSWVEYAHTCTNDSS